MSWLTLLRNDEMVQARIFQAKLMSWDPKMIHTIQANGKCFPFSIHPFSLTHTSTNPIENLWKHSENYWMKILLWKYYTEIIKINCLWKLLNENILKIMKTFWKLWKIFWNDLWKLLTYKILWKNYFMKNS